MPYAKKARAAPKRTTMRKRPTIRRPYYGNRYGNDAYVKVESIQDLSVQPSGGADVNAIFSTMRVNASAVGVGNTWLVT